MNNTHTGNVCSNPACRSTTTKGEWRHFPPKTGPVYCNACGIYLKEHQRQRPQLLVQKQKQSDARRQRAQTFGAPARAPALQVYAAPAPASAPPAYAVPAPAPQAYGAHAPARGPGGQYHAPRLDEYHQGFYAPGPAGRMPNLTAAFVPPPMPVAAPLYPGPDPRAGAVAQPRRGISIASILNSPIPEGFRRHPFLHHPLPTRSVRY